MSNDPERDTRGRAMLGETLVRGVLCYAPEAVEAMEAVIAFARDNTIGTISYQIVVDSDDGGPPLTLYLRIPKAEGQFRERREGIRQWWYTNWPEASKTVLLSVLPGRG